MKALYLALWVVLCGCQHTFGQTVTCSSLSSTSSNVFTSYGVTVTGATDFTLTYDPPEYRPGMRLPVGTSEVTVTAAMRSGSMTEIGNCTLEVTVDLQKLPIECPGLAGRISVPTDPGLPTYSYQPISIRKLPASMTYMYYGPITETTTFDGSTDPVLTIGDNHVMSVINDTVLSKTCVFTLIVEDQEPPTIVCPDDIFQNTTNIASFMEPIANDNVGVIGFSFSHLPGSQLPNGLTVVTATAHDAAGNTAPCNFTITVEFRMDETTPSRPATTGTTSTPASKVPVSASSNLPLIIGCAVGVPVVLFIIIIVGFCCCQRCNDEVDERPFLQRTFGASRHGVATDPVILNDKMDAAIANIYGHDGVSPTGDLEMTENPTYSSTQGGTNNPSYENHPVDVEKQPVADDDLPPPPPPPEDFGDLYATPNKNRDGSNGVRV